MQESVVVVNFELPEAQAYALVEVTKRLGYQGTSEIADDSGEAYLMVYALHRLREALGVAGVDAR